LWPAIVAQSVVAMQTPETPATVHAGGGVQHSSLAGPGHTPGVEV